MFKLTCTNPNEAFSTANADDALFWLHKRGAHTRVSRPDRFKQVLRAKGGRMTFFANNRTFVVEIVTVP